jgi:hypothetical protein
MQRSGTSRAWGFARSGDEASQHDVFQLRIPEPKPLNDRWLTSGENEPTRKKTLPDDASSEKVAGHEAPAESTSGVQRFRALSPRAWLALSGVAMLGWLIAIFWTAVEFVRWLVG